MTQLQAALTTNHLQNVAAQASAIMHEYVVGQ